MLAVTGPLIPFIASQKKYFLLYMAAACYTYMVYVYHIYIILAIPYIYAVFLFCHIIICQSAVVACFSYTGYRGKRYVSVDEGRVALCTYTLSRDHKIHSMTMMVVIDN